MDGDGWVAMGGGCGVGEETEISVSVVFMVPKCNLACGKVAILATFCTQTVKPIFYTLSSSR